MVEKIELKCTKNSNKLLVNLISRSPELLRVFVPGSDVQMSMPWVKTQYVGNRAGLEFTSTGRVEK